MRHFTLPRRAAWMALLALGILVVMAGCSKRVTSVDAGRTTLDGRTDANARMLAWRDAPVSLIVWADLGPAGPDDPAADVKFDTLIGRANISWGDPGVVRLAVLDKTPAASYQFYRFADNGGLQALTDYTILPLTKWLSTNWEMYGFDDQHPSSYSPTTYMGRGLLDGKVTTSSPLTNAALPDGATPAATTRFGWYFNKADSTIYYAWSTTPGAAGYWLDIYQLTGNTTAMDFYSEGAPNPVMTGGYVKHRVLEYWPANEAAASGTMGPMTLKTLAGPMPPETPAQTWLQAPARGTRSSAALAPRLAGPLGSIISRAALAGLANSQALAGPRVTGPSVPNALSGVMSAAAPRAAGSSGPDLLQESPFYRGQTYFARVTAVDAHGKVLSWMTGDYGFLQGNGYYYYIPLGAAIISMSAN